ncbi:MAG: tRNA preQ1(34) S-adenosylmethionine ribosyltransferase-isomerase QueA [Oscillospiraceae bacterium]|jgi:S-adenosylmethionine:tRNA ribosyltransferase-isomerase|nr:tRNA preQ1(34) S-adenosylmethionine ribosyltransferase-isomerase QueA [Oscillospiraceae bacterium]
MRTSDFYYDLPNELIAQTPIEPRDASRMMVCHRSTGLIEHRIFRDLPSYLLPGDALVINDTRVLPARLIGRKAQTGGAVEVLLLKRLSLNRWEALVKPGARLPAGSAVEFGGGLLKSNILGWKEGGVREVEFIYEGAFEPLLEKLGEMPLPPYIKEKLDDPERYQTVYAAQTGSAAAPTAGLHFTPELLRRAEELGVDVVRILLHVGLGTFRPVREENVEDHPMHAEYYELTSDAAARINKARLSGGRVICVGTTSVRALESASDEGGMVRAASGWTNIYLYPGVPIRAADALITNFHLPESTLLMLVSAMWNREAALSAYRLAVKESYRFFSFGDAMLIL